MHSVLAAGNFALTLHQGFARSVLLYSGILALWGFFQFLAGRNPSGAYLGALILMEALTVLQGIVGVVLFGQGHRPHDGGLHWLYGLLAVLTLPAAYSFSARGVERRDSLVFALATLFLIGVGIRAIGTGGT